uniref:Uncharacterized protein n=1 Tax=Rousettus aegyptiacus TaxID=9407 RepID=A0A7J8HR98_ROUAE|nr:hypothetical protein HJG63_010990 [Rousettus aegyptiacus]
MFSATFSSRSLIQSSASFTLQVNPSSVLLILVIKVFISNWFFFMVSMSLFMLTIFLLKFSQHSSTLPLSLLSIIITSVLNSVSGSLLASISLVLFLDFQLFHLGHVSFLILTAILCLFLCIRYICYVSQSCHGDLT